MTDWTKDDKPTSDDDVDKFYEWLDKDKANHKKHSKKLRPNKTKKIIFLGIFAFVLIGFGVTFFSNNSGFVSEEYFYISDYRLNKIPLFCTQEFIDPIFYTANDIMIEKTRLSILDWQEKIRSYTGNDDWTFNHKVIPLGDENSFSGLGCDATITFERLPPRNQEGLRGETAISRYGISDVVIFYLDSNGKRLDPDVDFVIKHEIGHVFGLAHPLLKNPYIIDESNSRVSNSIMITPEIYPQLPVDLKYVITDYDVRAIVNLYGGGISSSPLFFGYLNYVVIGVVLFVVAFIVNKKLKQS